MHENKDLKRRLNPFERDTLKVPAPLSQVGCVLDEEADYLAGPGRGAALDEAANGLPLLSEALARYRAGDHETLFENGLGLLIAGTEARLAGAVTPRA